MGNLIWDNWQGGVVEAPPPPPPLDPHLGLIGPLMGGFALGIGFIISSVYTTTVETLRPLWNSGATKVRVSPEILRPLWRSKVNIKDEFRYPKSGKIQTVRSTVKLRGEGE